jgi:hypothetical protein
MKTLLLLALLVGFAPWGVALDSLTAPVGSGRRVPLRLDVKLAEEALLYQRAEKPSASQKAAWVKFRSELNAEAARLTLEEARRADFTSRRDLILSPKYDELLRSCFDELFKNVRTLKADNKDASITFFVDLWWLYRLLAQRDFPAPDESSQLGQTRRALSDAQKQQNIGWFGILRTIGQKLNLKGYQSAPG